MSIWLSVSVDAGIPRSSMVLSIRAISRGFPPVTRWAAALTDWSMSAPRCSLSIAAVDSMPSGWRINRRVAGSRTSGSAGHDVAARLARVVTTRCTEASRSRRARNCNQPADIESAQWTSSTPTRVGPPPTLEQHHQAFVHIDRVVVRGPAAAKHASAKIGAVVQRFVGKANW